MIPVLTNVGRTVLTQVGRQFGRQAMQRLMQGERVEEVLSRDELRQLGQKLGKAGMTELFRQGKDAILEDHAKKNADWNARMNDFSRNLNEHLRQQTTLYKEDKNVANKEKIEDRRGLWNAYSSPTGLYKSGRTLYISGTGGKDGSLRRDIIDDLLLLPTRNAHHTEKYRDTMAKLNESPEIYSSWSFPRKCCHKQNKRRAP